MKDKSGDYKRTESTLTNNFHANIAIIILAWVAAVAVVFLGGSGAQAGTSILPALKYASMFTVFYVLCSYWLSPDLDCLPHVNRKRGSFPLGPFWAKAPKVLVIGFHGPLNWVYRAMWSFFAKFFTHRGAVHWPFFGTLLKATYIAMFYFGIAYAIKLTTGIKPPFVNGSIYADLFSKKGLVYFFSTNGVAVTFVIAWISADIAHSAIDFWDSFKKGSKFVPPAMIAPRGYFFSVLQLLTKK